MIVTLRADGPRSRCGGRILSVYFTVAGCDIPDFSLSSGTSRPDETHEPPLFSHGGFCFASPLFPASCSRLAKDSDSLHSATSGSRLCCKPQTGADLCAAQSFAISDLPLPLAIAINKTTSHRNCRVVTLFRLAHAAFQCLHCIRVLRSSLSRRIEFEML